MATLDNAIDQARRALDDFRRLRAGSIGWSDSQRRSLDRVRLDPLEEAASSLLRALIRAQQQIAAAERRLGG